MVTGPGEMVAGFRVRPLSDPRCLVEPGLGRGSCRLTPERPEAGTRRSESSRFLTDLLLLVQLQRCMGEVPLAWIQHLTESDSRFCLRRST